MKVTNPQYLQQYSIQSLERDYKHYYFIIRGDNTRAWINCEAQKLYLANMERGFQVKSYKKLVNAPEATSHVSKGCLVYYDWTDNGSIDHVAVGSMRDSYGKKYVCAHTSDRYNAIWTLGPYLDKDDINKIRYYIVRIDY